MDPELIIIILSEISQTEKNKYHAISFICGISKMTCELIYKTEKKKKLRNRLTDTENKLIVTKGERG